MSLEFKRKWKVSVGSLQTDALRIQFKVTKTLGKEPNSLDLFVWNLAEASRSKLKDPRLPVILEAGYSGQTTGSATIFSGATRTVDHIRDHADWKTHVQCGDGEKEYQFGFVNQNFSANQTFKDIVKGVAKQLSVNAGNLDQALDNAPKVIQNFTKGFLANGRASDVLTGLLKSAGLDWTVHQGSLLVTAPGQAASKDTTLLSPTTGLIGSPDHTPPDQKLKPATMKCKCLLNPQIIPASTIKIESAGVNGLFVVQKIVHTGDTHGQEWTTEIEAWAK